MPIGAFTGSFDLPLLLVIVFFLFFLALVYYLHQEDKREGYPLVSSRTSKTGGRVPVVGFPGLPTPKTFNMPHGRPSVTVPRPEEPTPVPAANAGNPDGMPVNDGIEPLGTNLGPGSWNMRSNLPDLSHDARPVFRPLRYATAYRVLKGEPDPRGFTVVGCDKAVAGTVVDIWIDEGEHHAKFLEVALEPQWAESRDAAAEANVDVPRIDPVAAPAPRHDRAVSDRPGPDDDETYGSGPAPAGTILLPMDFCAVVESQRIVRSPAITGAQFADVPGRRFDTILSAREENRLRGYYGGGYLWATPTRQEPWL